MVIELKANLPDTPGTLLKLLKPISDHAGNIYSVIHSHVEVKGGKVPVIVQFDLPHEKIQEKKLLITKELQNLSIDIVDFAELVKRETITVIISGHVFETDFVDTFKRINSAGANVARIEAIFTGVQDISNVKFEIQCDYGKVDATMDEVRAVCQEKNLTLITDR